MDNEDESSFLALSASLRRRIDRAFDSAASAESASQSEPGGFIIEDISPYIPLSEVPRALNLLDLSPDDDIMGVFKNAVRGWGAQDARNDGVSRKDWRAVCAALLEGDGSAGEDLDMGSDSGPDSDEYQMEELSGDTEGASSDEYEEPEPASKAKNARMVSARSRDKNSGLDVAGEMTEAQKAQCRQDFSRFFPDVPDDELDHQRIMMKNVVRVADLLKENLKAEEILDMLEAFASSPDKSMNLSDFEHMMTLTKLA